MPWRVWRTGPTKRGSDAERGAAGCQAVDGHDRAWPVPPARRRQPEAFGDQGLAVAGADRDAVGLVAELARHGQRRVAVLERPTQRGCRAEVVEGEGELPGPGLRAEALPVVRQAQPGPGRHLADHREVPAVERDHADRLPVAEDAEAQPPLGHLPGGEVLPVLAQDGAGAVVGGAL